MSERPDDLLTVAEIANRWRVSKMTVYRMIREGALPALQIGSSFRVRRADRDFYEKNSTYLPN